MKTLESELQSENWTQSFGFTTSKSEVPESVKCSDVTLFRKRFRFRFGKFNEGPSMDAAEADFDIPISPDVRPISLLIQD